MKDDVGKTEGKKNSFYFPPCGEEKNLDYSLDMGVPRLDESSECSLQLQ